MKIPTAQQMRELDAFTIQNEPISSIDLMERAAQKVTLEIMGRWDNSKPVVVFAGPGNNGGDALAVARMLSQHQYRVTAFLFNINETLSEDCERNKEQLEMCPEVSFTEVKNQFEAPVLDGQQLIVDGLFGTGMSRPLNGGFASLVKFINSAGAPVVSIDMPSGLMCEDNSNNIRGNIVCATLTLTFQLPKRSLLLADNQPYVGELRILDIGLSAQAIAELDTDMVMTEEEEIRTLLKPRDPFGHKGTFGHALLVAGKYGMAGAAVLSARACLKCGVGKVTVHTPKFNNDILQLALPEAILSHDLDDRMMTNAISTEPYSAMGIGMGLGTMRQTAMAFIDQVRYARIPMVVDADGLNILGGHKGWIREIPRYSILTPHPLELQRMTNCNTDSYSMLAEARRMAIKHQLYVVLKGHYTAICTPEGKTYLNATGNCGMATAGSGDVLSGIITALLAQKYTPLDACRLGVYLHGLAGDLAARELGETCVIASDIIQFLPKAFRQLEKKENNHIS